MKAIADYDKVFIIRIGHRGAGFFAFVQYALNQIRHCERHNLLPVINYDSSHNNTFYDPTRGPNMWDYYFHPPAGYSFEDIRTRLEDSDDPLRREHMTCLTDEEISDLCQRNPDSIYHYTYGYWRSNPPSDARRWYDEQRRKGQAYVAKYLKINEAILETVDQFMSTKNDYWVGAHIRGTDMRYAPTVPLQRYFEHFDKTLEERTNARLFVATDQQQYIDALIDRYGNRLVYQNCLRSESEVVPHKMRRENPSRAGDEVLMDAIILSRCDFLLKCPSAVGEFAHYLNPNLRSLDLNFDQTVVAGDDYSSVRFDRSRKRYLWPWNRMRTAYRRVTPEPRRQRALDRMLGLR